MNVFRSCCFAVGAALATAAPPAIAQVATAPDASLTQSVERANATFGATSRFATRYAKNTTFQAETKFSIGVGRFCLEIEGVDDPTPIVDDTLLFGRNVRCVGAFGTLRAPSNGSRLVDTAVDRVAVSASVTQTARRRLQASGRQVFFFVRTLNFSFGAIDAAGVGGSSAPFGAAVRLRLVGAGAGELTVVASDLFGRRDGGGAFERGATQNGRQQIAILGGENLTSGQVFAELRTNGLGEVRAVWDVLEPGRGALADEDLRSESELTDEERRRLTSLRPVRRANGARFRVRARARRIGQTLLLEGPRYSELPRSIPGRYVLVLRIEDTFDVATAAPLDTLPYIVQPRASDLGRLEPRLTMDEGAAALLTWRPPGSRNTLRLQWRTVDAQGGLLCEGVAAIRLGRIELPPRCAAPGVKMTVETMDPDGMRIGRRIQVSQ